MMEFFTALLGRVCSLALFQYLGGFVCVAGCFRLVWRLVLPRGADSRTMPD